MSRRRDAGTVSVDQAHAPIFAALGDGTRLRLLRKLSRGEPRSITDLAFDAEVTRQAITKHLRVLEKVGLVWGERRGRETVFTFTPEKLEKAQTYLQRVSQQWDETLDRLKAWVEDDPKI